jgi:ketopantoate reductase
LRLARGGEEVTFIARGANLRALRENGMHIPVRSPTARSAASTRTA